MNSKGNPFSYREKVKIKMEEKEDGKDFLPGRL